MTTSEKPAKRHIIAAALGNSLEWYDFAVFGFVAPIIGEVFFPSHDPSASLIKAFGVFAAGYLIRPFGGIIFGHIGDRLGRKPALLLSVMVMGTSTASVGLLPTYTQAGLAAPVMLVVLRLLHGLSVGGEFIGSISYIGEVSRPENRGISTSWATFSLMGGIVLGSGVASLLHNVMGASAFLEWG